MSKNFRPTAIPLITVDPFTSVWSFTDELYNDTTRHWTGHSQSMYGALLVDGAPFRFLGKTSVTADYFPEGPALKQTSVKVDPTTTTYTFTHPACDLTVTFVTPLLLDRLEVMSRPASYVFYEITPKEEGHSFEVYFDVSCELAGDLVGQNYIAKEEPGHAWVGSEDQKLLNRSGDDVRIEWGYLHLVHPNAKVLTVSHRLKFFKKRISARHFNMDISAPIPHGKLPLLGATSDKLADTFVVAYDDVKSIEYYHKPMDAYYKKLYGDFDTMLAVAVKEADELRAACAEFDKKFIAEMQTVSENYANVGALAYRQAIAAHKLVDVDGKLMFFSKENFSNGCMATLDVTYPSIPLFLRFNPELVRGMMRPLFEYARTELWPYKYAPHDCGQYPLCNGQVYSAVGNVVNEQAQMPVEECGNAILTVAATWAIDGDRTLADESRDLLEQWADYLVEFGYDPGFQLCTDDFAGHLAHNCNLSLKAITALGAYAKMFDQPKYAEIAKDMADRWVKEAKKQNGEGWRLTFDLDDTWSMKYNIIWDRLLGLNLFDKAVSEEEIRVYTAQMNRYGVPLDSRSDYTKLDWMAWTTVMTDNKEYTDAVYASIARTICDSLDRVPITDWYYTLDARHAGFQARSVLGGFYINLIAGNYLNK
ncbi:MAG: DUF4965 domain-containing protein [Clostridia bacterium]|nr:DUF4965 domain-containing protein [Clostridia bacterium]